MRRPCEAVMRVLAVALAVTAANGTQAATGARFGPPPDEAAPIIARALQAMGGRRRLTAIKAVRLETVSTPATGTAVEIAYTFTRPNRERKEIRGRRLIEYDGTRVSVQVLDPAKGPGPPRFEPEDRNRDFEIEIGFYVPAFLDHRAEYAGATEVNGRACHQVRVTLPLGSRLTYAIDASTYLIARVRAEVLDDGELTVWSDRLWSDYRAVDGIRYPHTIVSANRDGSSARTIVQKVEFSR